MHAVFALALTAVPVAAAESVVRLDLPAQPLGQALTAVGTRTHSNIVFPPDAVAGLTAPALHGSYSAEDALDTLLANTGLDATRTRGGAWIITRHASPPLPVTATPAAAPATFSEPPTPTIIVKGYRSSLVAAAQLKKLNTGVVDSIVAEDMAKFPDNNLAEAIQRMPGVSITRDQGEGRSITVRGLGPDFTRVEVNGLEAQAATDGLAEGLNRGRGFDFNVFPSELFSRVDVEKTSRADHPEGSLGATVNLVTPHPFDYTGLKLVAAAQGSYNQLGDDAGWRSAGLVSNRFAGGRFGLLVSVAASYTPLELQGVNSGGWTQGTANGGFCRPTAGTGRPCDVPAGELAAATAAYNQVNSATTYVPRFYRYTDLTGHVARLGFTASAQWQPSPRTLVTLDLLYARYHTERYDHFLEAIGFSRGASQGGRPESVPRDAVVDGNGTLVNGRFDNVDVRSEVTLEDFYTTFKQGSLRVRHEFTPRLRFEGLAGAAHSRFDNDEMSAQLDRFNVDNYVFDLRGGGQNHPSISYGFDVTDPANWYFGPRVTQSGGTGAAGPELRLRPNYTRNGFTSAEGRLVYDLAEGWQVSAGAEAKRYSFRTIAYRLDLGESDFPAPANGLSGLVSQFCGLSGVAPPAGTPRCWLVPDVAAFSRAYDLYSGQGRAAVSTTNPAARGFNQAVTEDDTSLFAMLDFDRPVLGHRVRGNLGLRHVRTRQASFFYANVPAAVDPAGFRPARVERSYSDDLPSLNLAVETSPHTLVRFSAASVMARPPLASLAADTSVLVNGGARLVTTGNPNLEPYRADSLDLSLEWYPQPGTLAAASLFHKDISTYIQTLTHVAPYATTGLPVSLLANTGVAATDDFNIQSTINTPGGTLSGIELSYQARLSFLPGRWSGLGVMVNYTWVASRIDYFTTTALGATTVSADLLYLSRNSCNATLWYSRGRFEARLSMNYRDRYLTAVPGAFNTDVGGMNAAAYVDASSSYRLSDRVTVSFEALNLTGEPNVTWNDSVARRVNDYRYGSRRFHAGVRYVF